MPTPLPSGPMAIGVTHQGVAAAGYVGSVPPDAPLCTDEHRIALVTGRLAEYFAGRRRELELPLDLRSATGPHRAVLETLHRTVPYGETVTYGRLAERSGVFEEFADSPGLAARTVGQMMGANPVALLVPCHRVVAAGRYRRLRRRAGGAGGQALAADPGGLLGAHSGLERPSLRLKIDRF